MASSKKTGSPRSKPAKSKAEETKIEDAVLVESETSLEKAADASNKPDVKDEKASDAETPDAPVEDAAAQAEKNEGDTPTQNTLEKEQPETEKVKEPEAVKPKPARTPEPAQKSVFLPLVLGGIVAGALGFMASEYEVFGNADADITTKLRSDLSAQQERIATLETATPAAVEIPEIDLAPIESQLAEIQERLVALEERPVVSLPEGIDATYTAELEALKASAETQRSEIEELLNNAQSVEQATADAARAARAQAAIAKIVSAIDAGQPYTDAVATLSELDLGEIDQALATSADSGVATLSSLQSEFPEQARTALAAARANSAEEGQQGFGGFLKRSLGARSVAPREGSDPDAVLSRAEAAIKSGDLTATLNELDTLPEEAQAAIADWRAAADARLAARNAADALAQRLTAD